MLPAGVFMGLTMRERHRITEQIAQRYRTATRQAKGRILDEFMTTTGYNRKYAIHLLQHWGKSTFVHLEGQLLRLKAGRKKQGSRKGRTIYGPELYQPLVRLWILHNRLSGKLLAPAIRENRERLAASPSLGLGPGVLDALCRMSPATIDRRLAARKRKDALRGITHTRPAKALKHLVPVRTAADWKDARPGEFQADTVGHDGGVAKGEFCFTLVLVDVASGWTELRALKNRAMRWVAQAMEEVRAALPFPFLALHTDNGGEFINLTLARWCGDHGIAFTRSRAERKNDNCYVECRNDDVVRRAVGYGRFDTDLALQALAAFYRSAALLANHFLPTMRYTEKTRVGGRVRKRYDTPRTPYRRLLESPKVPEKAKMRLRSIHASLDLVDLKLQYDEALDRLLPLARTWGACDSPGRVPALG